MNFENINLYSFIVNDDKELIDKAEIVDIGIINIICMSAMFLINCIFIIIISNLEYEAEYEVITAQDFTLLISDIDREELTHDLSVIMDDILCIDGIKPIEINPTYKISEYIAKKEKFGTMKKQLRVMMANEVSNKIFYINYTDGSNKYRYMWK